MDWAGHLGARGRSGGRGEGAGGGGDARALGCASREAGGRQTRDSGEGVGGARSRRDVAQLGIRQWRLRLEAPRGRREKWKEPGRDQASPRCWPAFPGVLGAGGRTRRPPPPVSQLRIPPRTPRRSWHSQPYFPTETVRILKRGREAAMESSTLPLNPLALEVKSGPLGCPSSNLQTGGLAPSH